MVSLELKDSIVTYKNNDLVVSVGVPKSLQELLKIKEFDMGYIVVDARYTHGIVEEYIDLDYGLSILGLADLRDNYFRGIRGEDMHEKSVTNYLYVSQVAIDV